MKWRRRKHKHAVQTLAKEYYDTPKLKGGIGGWYCHCCNPMNCAPRKMKDLAHRILRRKKKMELQKEEEGDYHYSDPNSREFWGRINLLSGEAGEEAYDCGCHLQNVEQQVLDYIKRKESEDE